MDGVVNKEIQWWRETWSHRPAGQNFQPPDKIHLAESESLPPDYTLIKSDICKRTLKVPSQNLRPTQGFNEQILQQIHQTLVILQIRFYIESSLLIVLKIANLPQALPFKMSQTPEYKNTVNPKSASFFIIMILHERLTHTFTKKA